MVRHPAQTTGAGTATSEERRACFPDVQGLCDDLMAESPAAILACLKKNRDKLSDACRAILDKRGQ
jgi:hypothetical protein